MRFGNQEVVLTIDSGKLILDRSGSITIEKAAGTTWRIAPHIALVARESFVAGNGIENCEKVIDVPEHRKACVTYALKADRKLIVEVDIYKELPGALITCKVLNLGEQRREYFFWSFPTAQTYLTESENGKARKVASPTRIWKPLDFRRWIYVPEKGIALITRGYLGYAGKRSFLNVRPQEQYVDAGDWMEARFFIATPCDVDALRRCSKELFDSGLLTAHTASSGKALNVERKGRAYYGKPAHSGFAT